MDLTPYVDLLRRDLSSAAEVGGDQGREAARTLLVALEPAARLALMEAVGIVDTHLLGSHRRGTSGVWRPDGTPVHDV